jgi:predicted GTPase
MFQIRLRCARANNRYPCLVVMLRSSLSMSNAFENSMIHFIRPEELAVAVQRHDSQIRYRWWRFAPQAPSATLVPLLHETTSVTLWGPGDEPS